MPDKYQNKYRIPSARLQTWNYGWYAAYFVTICTQKMKHYFGKIVNGKMQLSDIGNIAKNEWIKTFEMRPDMNLTMDEYVIMPNHFHAIIIIGKNEFNTKRGMNHGMDHGMNHGMDRGMDRTDAMNCVSSNTNNPTKNQFGPQSKNLASIIRGYKTGVTTNARKIHTDFAWQPRYHDHIIRDNQSYQRIKKYIINNPKKWDKDKFKD